MARYAAQTEVPVDRTRAEIERTLVRYGADAFRYSYRSDVAMVEFSAHARHIRFVLRLPKQEDFNTTPQGRDRVSAAIEREWQQACRQRWRALLLAIKAKLEAVDCGIAEFEREFLAYIVDPESDRTVGDVLAPQLQRSYDGAPTPLLLTQEHRRAERKE